MDFTDLQTWQTRTFCFRNLFDSLYFHSEIVHGRKGAVSSRDVTRYTDMIDFL